MTEIKDRRSLLRIKVKTLAAEARVIRREELRTKGPLREEMYHHRTHDVRLEARATQLAYGMLRGRTEQQIEPHPAWRDAAAAARLRRRPCSSTAATVASGSSRSI